jgi:uncharacterized protein (TIGR00725 family)
VEHRRIIIGAVGGDKQKEVAMAFGKAVAEAGCILLTGGKPQDSDEVKDAALLGAAAAESGNSVARIVGILPSETEAWEMETDRRLFLHTGLRHNFRNVINGVTPDVLVIFGGGKGTLAETAFALATGKPLFFCDPTRGTVVKRLLANFRRDFVSDSVGDEVINQYLRQPVNTFPGAWTVQPSVENLKTRLEDLLMQPQDTPVSAGALVARCITAAAASSPLDRTGFPGLPGNATAVARFDEIVERMSR